MYYTHNTSQFGLAIFLVELATCGLQLPYYMAQVNTSLRQVQSSLSSATSSVLPLRSGPSRIGPMRPLLSVARPSTMSWPRMALGIALPTGPQVVLSSVVHCAQLLESHLHKPTLHAYYSVKDSRNPLYRFLNSFSAY